jgi:lysozyme
VSARKTRTATGTKIAAGAAIAAALGFAVPEIMRWEGKHTVTYADVAGIPTACYGHTGKDVGPLGKRWSDNQCWLMLDTDVRTHMDGVLRCTPALARRPRQLAAPTILAFNIGAGAFCRSTIARHWQAGDWRGGCNAFRLWNRAGGRAIPGLARRREAERAICLQGL